MEYTAVGSHDKSDWVLYKKSDPENEIWSSKNDIVNKTTAPSELGSQLEFSTEYILKLRYHDATNDIWSNWGELEFTTASRFSDSSLKFTMRADGDETSGNPYSKLYAAFNPVSDVYHHWADDPAGDTFDNEAFIGKDICPIDLYINNTLSNERISFYNGIGGNTELGLTVQEPKANDIIEFVLRNSSSGFILPTNAKTIKYIKSFLAPLPKPVRMKSNLGKYDPLAVEDITSLINLFIGTFIEDIPSFFLKNCNKVKDFTYLFRSNSGITLLKINSFACSWDISGFVDFLGCFTDCKTLAHVEKHIFGENNQSTPISVSYMFNRCSNLTSVDPDVFKGVHLTNVRGLFQDCTSLRDAEINLVSSPNLLRSDVDYFADGCPTPITVRVKANSTTASSFKESSTANVNIIEE